LASKSKDLNNTSVAGYKRKDFHPIDGSLFSY
jgi:hypothetical protein